MARSIGKSMAQSLGQPIIIDNKPGGGGVIALGETIHEPADGYTLVFPSILLVTNPALMADFPYDVEKEFAPVTIVGSVPHVLVVSPDFPAKTLAEFVAMAKAKPNSMSYGSSGIGTSAHLAGAMFAEQAGIVMTHVPYRGAGPAVQNLLGGQIQLMFLDMTSALPQIKAGKLRALAIAPSTRSPVLPDVPTIAEQGYPNFNVKGWYGLLVRTGTPDPIVQKLYQETRRALQDNDVRKVFLAAGIEPGGMPPAEFGATIHSDLVRWKQVVHELNIKLD
jgi:tripartite-type tricarboxylate transporter receptor subunit TctC